MELKRKNVLNHYSAATEALGKLAASYLLCSKNFEIEFEETSIENYCLTAHSFIKPAKKNHTFYCKIGPPRDIELHHLYLILTGSIYHNFLVLDLSAHFNTDIETLKQFEYPHIRTVGTIKTISREYDIFDPSTSIYIQNNLKNWFSESLAYFSLTTTPKRNET